MSEVMSVEINFNPHQYVIEADPSASIDVYCLSCKEYLPSAARLARMRVVGLVDAINEHEQESHA